MFQTWIPKSLATSIRVKWGFPATNHRYQREKPSRCHASPDAPDLPEERRSVFDLPRDRRGSREEPVVIRARIAAAGESLKILSGPPAALSTIELARSINELTDRSIRQVHAACHDGHRVACRSGCTYCCMFPVAASAPEVLAIATFVRERFDEERQAALDRPRRGQYLGDRGHGHEPEGSRQAGLPLPRGGQVHGLRGQADRMPGILIVQRRGLQGGLRASGNRS